MLIKAIIFTFLVLGISFLIGSLVALKTESNDWDFGSTLYVIIEIVLLIALTIDVAKEWEKVGQREVKTKTLPTVETIITNKPNGQTVEIDSIYVYHFNN